MQNTRSISTIFTAPFSATSTVAILNRKAIPFSQFTDDVGVVCNRLQRHGGERWLLLCEDAYAIAVGFLATLYMGRTAVFPANLQPGHTDELADKVDGILTDRQNMLQNKNCLEIFQKENISTTVSLKSLAPPTGELILHTSGSTGEPLAVQKTLNSLEAELNAFFRVFEKPGPYSILATVPAYHIYGLLFRVLWPLLANRPFVSEMIRYPEELKRVLNNSEKYLLISSPAFLVRAQRVLDVDMLKLKTVGLFSSGGPLPPRVAEAYNTRLNSPIIEVYGSTETGGIGYRSVYDAANPTPLKPLPGVTVAIDENTGLLSVQSPFLSQGHHVETNDLAKLLPNGCFELLGRADRIVKIEERRISLREIEQKLLALQEVAAIRVELLDGKTGRKFLGALILPTTEGWATLSKNGKRALTRRLRDALKPYIPLSVIPRKWRFIRKMPETEHGKIILSQLQTIFNQGQPEVTEPCILDRTTRHSSLQLTLKLPPDLKYFKGHFDDHPILAGMVQLGWAIEYARDAFSLGATVKRIEALKFYHVLTAGDEVVLNLDFEREKNKLYFKFSSRRCKHSAGRVLFGAVV